MTSAMAAACIGAGRAGRVGAAPVKAGPAIVDFMSGIHLYAAIVTALYERQITGMGRMVEVAMQDAMVNYCRIAYSRQLLTNQACERNGNSVVLGNAPCEVFRCSPGGHNDYVFIYTSRATNSHWERLCELIGREEGFTVTSSAGGEYLVFRPLLSEFVVSMPRGAAVVYPKDAAQIVALADIFPGATVVEAGVGSGALTRSLLRAVGPHGRVLSFERREEFADLARANVTQFFGGEHPAWRLEIGDLAEALPASGERCDRIILDMLAPWECLDAAADALLLLSSADNLPYTALEAAACGCPVIALDAGGVREAARDGLNAMVLPLQTDAPALAFALAQFASLPAERRAEMGTRGRDLAAREFAHQDFLRRYETLFSELAQRA